MLRLLIGWICLLTFLANGFEIINYDSDKFKLINQHNSIGAYNLNILEIKIPKLNKSICVFSDADNEKSTCVGIQIFSDDASVQEVTIGRDENNKMDAHIQIQSPEAYRNIVNGIYGTFIYSCFPRNLSSICSFEKSDKGTNILRRTLWILREPFDSVCKNTTDLKFTSPIHKMTESQEIYSFREKIMWKDIFCKNNQNKKYINFFTDIQKITFMQAQSSQDIVSNFRLTKVSEHEMWFYHHKTNVVLSIVEKEKEIIVTVCDGEKIFLQTVCYADYISNIFSCISEVQRSLKISHGWNPYKIVFLREQYYIKTKDKINWGGEIIYGKKQPLNFFSF